MAAWSCLVRTQLRFSSPDGLRRPDLELRFLGVGEDGDVAHIVLWVEVKHGTAPHTGQLQAYLCGQRSRLLQNALVLLVASRGAIPAFLAGEIPPEVPKLSWQDTAERLKTYSPPGAVGQFLIGELCQYLKEEGLMDPEQLTPVHLVALANHDEAVTALDRV